MEILEIKINDSIVHVIYLHNGIKYMHSFIAETAEKVVEVINDIIKNPTE
jgi:hypothetical protein